MRTRNNDFPKWRLGAMVWICSLLACGHVTKQTFRINVPARHAQKALHRVAGKTSFREEPKKPLFQDSLVGYFRWPHPSDYVFGFAYQIDSLASNRCSLETFTLANSKQVADNLSLILHTFLNQELHPDFRKRGHVRLYKPSLKNKSELIQKTFVNAGQGIFYAGQNNPFVNKQQNRIHAFALGAIDVGLWGVALTGPALGKTTEEGIAITSLALVGLVGFKVLVLALQALDDLEAYDAFANSGYEWPARRW